MGQGSGSLKQRIRDGEVIISLRISITTERSQLEDALAKGSYDLIYLDCQHTDFSEAQLVSFCAMAEELGLPVEIRIPHTRQAYLAGRYCDLGPAAILVPEVTSTTTVDEAIEFFYYPQQGKRSWGGAARYGVQGRSVDRLTYAAWWNESAVLGIQLESVEAIINARQLAKPGIDYVAFGPNDLEFSLEGHSHVPLRTTDACMRHVAEQLEGTGIRMGMAIIDPPEDREKYLAMGVTIFQEAPKA
jgi:2-keto-3-deoxy-L-rhamnonate aldolase RhmA